MGSCPTTIGEKMTEEQLQKEDSNYRPLEHGLFIEESMIDGQGLFASEVIKEETDLGISHYEVEPDKMSEKILIRTPLGGFINHKAFEHDEHDELIDGPNCIRIQTKHSAGLGNMSIWSLKTIKEISPGEELTVEYKLYNPKS